MSSILPQIAVHRILKQGMQDLKSDPSILDEVFAYYKCNELFKEYGEAQIDKIKQWISEVKIPVVQAWSMNPQLAPQISIKLGNEQEDESKSAIGDHWGMGEESDIGMASMLVYIDIRLHANRNSDEVLWMYHIVKYILFKRKRLAEKLGLQLHTFSATDYSREDVRLPENIFSRYIRLRTVVQDKWTADPYLDIEDIETVVIPEPAP